MHAELLDLIGRRNPGLGRLPPDSYAGARRGSSRGATPWLETWKSLAIGEPLPILPFWLTDDLAIPLDLEASYEQPCSDLRIAQMYRRTGSPGRRLPMTL